jgi:hypothetical protein
VARTLVFLKFKAHHLPQRAGFLHGILQIPVFGVRESIASSEEELNAIRISLLQLVEFGSQAVAFRDSPFIFIVSAPDSKAQAKTSTLSQGSRGNAQPIWVLPNFWLRYFSLHCNENDRARFIRTIPFLKCQPRVG